ncbi:hypothetical protein GLOIN_2v1789101 [Rhizophagus clarus]|uniref:Uncharacterized protein n=1 Tax=Rhizophagus clarus TaxID=94130 RepID=A0A8H3QKH2_9GLOM|nr:hypothetical protein GLOIN_2v1789101 [Rhizophagus clarus]
MARKKRGSSVITHKNILLIIDLLKDSNAVISSTSAITIGEALERHLLDNDDTLPNLEDYTPNDDEYSNDDDHDDDDDDNMIHLNNKRKIKDTEKEKDIQKRIRNSRCAQKVNEMYTDWKATGFGGHSESDTKWLEDTINQAISTISEKIKYPSEECHMNVCYDALSDANNEEFQNKIKRGGWKHFYNRHIHSLAQRLSRQARSNIVQLTSDEEKKFKNSDITRECYTKLNKPVDANDDPHYTYLNLIIDHVFTNPKTEKNSIAFGMAVALNYLDSSKGVNMVPSEVVERMNFFLDKMQVSKRESL